MADVHPLSSNVADYLGYRPLDDSVTSTVTNKSRATFVIHGKGTSTVLFSTAIRLHSLLVKGSHDPSVRSEGLPKVVVAL